MYWKEIEMHYLVLTTPVSDDGSTLVHSIRSGQEGLKELHKHGFVSHVTEPLTAAAIARRLGQPVPVVQPMNGPVQLRLRRGDVVMRPTTPWDGDTGLAFLQWEVWRLPE